LEFRALLPRIPSPDVAPVQARLEFEPVESAGDVTVISSEAGLAEALATLGPEPDLAVFGLWDGPARKAQMVGLGLAAGAASTFYLPLGHLTGEPMLPAGEVAAGLGPLLAGRNLLGHDAKETELALRGAGL